MSVNKVGVVLAAGLGSRLRPSTDFCPKPLIPVAGIEPLYFSLYTLSKLGVPRVIVNAHYLHKMIFAALEMWKTSFPNLEIRVSNEASQLLGTGGALLKIVEENKDWLQGSSLVVFNGDTLAQIDLSPMLSSGESLMAVSKNPKYLEKYGPVWLDAEGVWSGIGRSAPAPGLEPAHFLGVHQLSQEALLAIPRFCGETRAIDLFNGIYRPLVEQGLLFRGFDFPLQNRAAESWFDITNKEFLLEAQSYILQNAATLGWDRLLRQRYPEIQELSRGCWSLSHHEHEAVTLRAPSLFVNSSSKSSPYASLELNAGACWIQEKPLKLASSDQKMVVENSIVLLKKEVNNELPSSVHDEVVLA